MNRQRGFAALMLMLLVLLLLAIPTMYLEHELSERQRALDRRIKKMLATTSVRSVSIAGDVEARSRAMS